MVIGAFLLAMSYLAPASACPSSHPARGRAPSGPVTIVTLACGTKVFSARKINNQAHTLGIWSADHLIIAGAPAALDPRTAKVLLIENSPMRTGPEDRMAVYSWRRRDRENRELHHGAGHRGGQRGSHRRGFIQRRLRQHARS